MVIDLSFPSGFSVNDGIPKDSYLDEPLALRLPGTGSAAMMCQLTTLAVSHMFGNLGFQCTNYIDDFGGAESASKATMAFETLEELFSILRTVA